MEWLPDGHLAHFILEVVSTLDLSEIEDDIQSRDGRGTRPYHPAMMVAILLYGCCVGVFSSRKLERATYEDVAFRVLAGGQHPNFTRIAGFRKRYLRVLRDLFVQVLKVCQKVGMVKLGHVAIDGTKVQGNASKHKAMSYERMIQQELQLGEEVDALLNRAAEVDGAEDARYGVGCRDEDLPAELRRRENRLAHIRQAKATLEADAAQARARQLREQAARASERAKNHSDPVERKRAATVATNRATRARELDPTGSDDDIDAPATGGGLPKHEPRTNTDGTPHAKAQMNFTDPDSRIMESGGSFVQGYNCQAAVDEAHQIIVAHDVSNKSPDNGNLIPMVGQVKQNCDRSPDKTSADAGYWVPEAPAACEKLGTDAHISTRRRKHGESAKPESAKPESAEPESETAAAEDPSPREKMREKLLTEDGRSTYARRKAVVEPVFGQIKEARGFRRFLLRGLDAVQAEWAFVCTGHNLLKLFRFLRAQSA